MEAFAAKVEGISEDIAGVVRAQRRIAKVKKLLMKYELLPMLNVSEANLDVTLQH
jgi:hypothetical protein